MSRVQRRRIGVTVAGGALFALTQPIGATAHPVVSFLAPAEGATISGVVGVGPACEVQAGQTTTSVDFYLDGRHINNERAAPWNCPFDSRTFSDGTHTLKAVAQDGRGDTTATSVQINIANAGGEGGAPAGGGKATLRPVGSGPLGDEEAASRVRPWSHEPRPRNTTANRTRPSRAQLDSFYGATSWGRCEWLRRRVTGNFTGTTDEIIQWAAHKWGLDEDLVRAVAVVESNWNQLFHGDVGNGESYGLMQVKSRVNRGTYPLSRSSTAFNVDFYGAGQRFYFEGCADWLGNGYRAGDMWGSVGAWYSGRWHNTTAEGYISKVKHELWNRSWEKSGF